MEQTKNEASFLRKPYLGTSNCSPWAVEPLLQYVKDLWFVQIVSLVRSDSLFGSFR